MRASLSEPRAAALRRAPRSVLVVGASHGVGYALAAHLVLQAGSSSAQVHATVRTAADGASLTALGARVHLLDVTNASQRAALVSSLEGEAPGLQALYHVAGVRGGNQDLVYATNLVAPFALLELLMPLLMRGREQELDDGGGKNRAVAQRRAPRACIVTSDIRFGPRANRTLRSHYAHSKAAANERVRALAPQLFARHGLLLVAIHPGSVRTQMNRKGKVDASDSAAGVRAACEQATRPPEGILTSQGKQMPWSAP